MYRGAQSKGLFLDTRCSKNDMSRIVYRLKVCGQGEGNKTVVEGPLVNVLRAPLDNCLSDKPDKTRRHNEAIIPGPIEFGRHRDG